jgi:replicative DNA helicase
VSDAHAERQPPHNREAERSVLGSCLRDNGVIGDVQQILPGPGLFYHDAHQRIYRGVLALHDEGSPADLVTLAEWIDARGWLKDVGGAPYLAELWDAAPTAANAEYYARIVRDKGQVRNLIHASTEILRDAYDQAQPADELLEAAERKIFDLAQGREGGRGAVVAEVVTRSLEGYDRRAKLHDNPHTAAEGVVPFPWEDLQELTAGLHPAELIVIAARTSVGKTCLASGLARAATLRGVPVFFVSLEQRDEELVSRLLCAEARVDSHGWRRADLNKDEYGKVMAAAEGIARTAAPLVLNDACGQTMQRIAAAARWWKLKKGVGLVVVDYLQLVEPEDRRATRQEQVAGVSRRLKRLARELNVPVVALAQLNRAAEGRQDKRPQLADLRESDAIGQDADVVLLLHKPEDQLTGNVDRVEVLIRKQRNGPTGRVELRFHKAYMTFEDAPRDDIVIPRGF